MFGAGAADPHRQRHRLQPAADHRPLDQRRLRISARGARGTGPGEPRQRHAGRRRRGQPGPAPGPRVLDLHRDDSVRSTSTSTATRRRRSASTSTTSSPRCSRRSAGSSSTTSTSTAAPGRSISRARRADRRDISDIWQIIRAQQDRRDGADALDRRPAHRRRPAGDHALQQLSLGHDQRQPRARRLLGRRARRRCRRCRPRPCRPATPSNGPAPPIRSTRRAARPAPILAMAVVFAFLFLVGLYESWMIPIPVLLSVVVGVLGAYAGIMVGRPDARSLCADRPRRADRAGRQERHPHRRIRQGAARVAGWRSARPRRSARACASAR